MADFANFFAGRLSDGTVKFKLRHNNLLDIGNKYNQSLRVRVAQSQTGKGRRQKADGVGGKELKWPQTVAAIPKVELADALSTDETFRAFQSKYLAARSCRHVKVHTLEPGHVVHNELHRIEPSATIQASHARQGSVRGPTSITTIPVKPHTASHWTSYGQAHPNFRQPRYAAPGVVGISREPLQVLVRS